MGCSCWRMVKRNTSAESLSAGFAPRILRENSEDIGRLIREHPTLIIPLTPHPFPTWVTASRTRSACRSEKDPF